MKTYFALLSLLLKKKFLEWVQKRWRWFRRILRTRQYYSVFMSCQTLHHIHNANPTVRTCEISPKWTILLKHKYPDICVLLPIYKNRKLFHVFTRKTLATIQYRQIYSICMIKTNLFYLYGYDVRCLGIHCIVYRIVCGFGLRWGQTLAPWIYFSREYPSGKCNKNSRAHYLEAALRYDEYR